jgi:CDP-paratose 2-epimerase
MIATRSLGPGGRRTVLVTGGAGFIGTNLIDRLASEGDFVILYDDLSRGGVQRNLHWLLEKHPDRIEVQIGSVCDPSRLRRLVRRADAVIHLAAQVAVTTSLDDPRADFEVNLEGTLNVLESMRLLDDPPHLVFTSTNKVYGSLEGMELREDDLHYSPRSPAYAHGVSEGQHLDFCGPYGCSKGGADQYVLDYARSFELPTTVFRMSCIYGPHQHGTEDQGWVAHFMLRALRGRPITIYGDGKQVRDVLYVDDLVEAFSLALSRRSDVVGRAFNLGGGPGRVLSPLELVDEIERLEGKRPLVSFEDWRVGDQRWYVSDTSAFERATGWGPATARADGLRRLHDWLREHAPIFAEPERSAVAAAG